MRTIQRGVMILASVAALSVPATVRAQDLKLESQVPFAFNAGHGSLPADSYYISRMDGQSDVLMVRSRSHGAMVLVQRADAADVSGTPELVFHRYGDQYFLRGIRFSGSLEMTLPESRDEHEAADRAPRSASAAGIETVVIASRLR
jgi:hypothetical protein